MSRGFSQKILRKTAKIGESIIGTGKKRLKIALISTDKYAIR
jgi:hypothetical protein